jgi:O-antigen ligase
MKSKFPAFLENFLILILSFQFAVRIFFSGDASSDTTNLLVHCFIWVALCIFFLKAFLENRLVLNFYGIEIPLLLFLVSILLSTIFASYKYVAGNFAFGYISFITLALLILNLKPETCKSLFINLLLSVGFIVVIYAFVQLFYSFDILVKQIKQHPGLDPLLREEMLARAESKQVFSTFTLTNTFGGFLVVLLLLILGTLIDVFSYKGHKIFIFVLIQALFLTSGLGALYLTGSKGAMVAFLFGCLCFGAIYMWKKYPWARKFIISAGVLFVLLVIVALINFSEIAHRSKSMYLRGVYWQAAVKTMLAYPVFGVGLNNFQDFYTRYKSDYQQEVIRAHNDYLQIGADMGLIGLGIFCAILIFVIYRIFKTPLKTNSTTPAQGKFAGYIIGGVCLAFLCAYSLEGKFTDFGEGFWLAGILFCMWLVYFLITHSQINKLVSENSRFATIGLGAGFLGLLCHMFVDFDFSTFEMGQIAFVLIGLVIVFSKDRYFVEYKRVAGLVGMVIAGVVLCAVGGYLLPKINEARNFVRKAKEFAKVGDFQTAVKNYQNAVDKNPWDVRLYMEAGQACFSFATQVKLNQAEWYLEQAINFTKKASHIRPANSGIWRTLANYWYHLGVLYKLRSVKMYDKWDARWRGIITENVIPCALKAVENYPTNAHARFLLAKAYFAGGYRRKARQQYREALRLSEKAIECRTRPHRKWRLELSDTEIEIAKKRLTK